VTKTKRIWRGMALVALGLALTGGAVQAASTTSNPPCIVPDNGTGTVTLPPAGCGYVSPTDLHRMLNGLPSGTTVILDVAHHDFFCRQSTGPCVIPGGPLGGEVENFNSVGTIRLTGTGALAGWTRTLSIPLNVQTATAPRTPGDPVQSFTTDMLRIQGSITGDPDFDLFEIVGGTDNGQSSPGQTTLTRQADGSFKVDSNFQVGYTIRFIGAPNGKLSGYAGTTVGSVNMATGDPCN
jgi:hypothetical protein